MQQVAAILAGVITVLALLSQLLDAAHTESSQDDTTTTAAGRDGTSSNDGPVRTDPTMNPDTPLVVSEKGGTIIVNGVSFSIPLSQTMKFAPGFPSSGHPVYLENGDEATQYEYRNASYIYQGDALVRILLPSTTEQITSGSTLAQAASEYGPPVHTYKSSTGLYYIVFPAKQGDDLAWVLTFSFTTKKITSVALCSCLKQSREDAKKAEEEAAAKPAPTQ